MESRGILSLALNLLAKAMVVGARWAGRHRSRALKAMAVGADEDKDRQIVLLQEQLAELQSLVEILKAMVRPTPARRYAPRVRLMILYHATRGGTEERQGRAAEHRAAPLHRDARDWLQAAGRGIDSV